VGAAFVVVAGPWVSIWNHKPIAPNLNHLTEHRRKFAQPF